MHQRSVEICYQGVVNNDPPLNEVTLLSPEIELSEIWGDTIVALFQILEFPWGDSIGALFKNSRSILHISTLQIRFKIAKFSRACGAILPF